MRKGRRRKYLQDVFQPALNQVATAPRSVFVLLAYLVAIAWRSRADQHLDSLRAFSRLRRRIKSLKLWITVKQCEVGILAGPGWIAET